MERPNLNPTVQVPASDPPSYGGLLRILRRSSYPHQYL